MKFNISLVELLNKWCYLFFILIIIWGEKKAFATQSEIEVTSYYAKVYVAPSTNANFIGLTQKGERYPILGKREGWYYIRFKNANGWIENTHVQLVDPNVAPPPSTTEESQTSESNLSPSSPVSTSSGSLLTSPPSPPSPPITRDTLKEEKSSLIKPPPAVEENKISVKPVETSSTVKKERSSQNKTGEKKESGIRSWFTQQNLPELPASVIPEIEDETHLKYFQVRLPTKVIAYLSPDAPSLGLAKRGLILPIIAEGESWCRVAFNDTVGWIEKRYGRIIDPENSSSLDFVKIGITLGTIAIIGIVIIVFVRIFISKKKKGENIVDRKEVLIVAKGSKIIQHSLTNSTTTIDRCFSEIGFSISFLHTISDIKDYLKKRTPEIILVDYGLGEELIEAIEHLFAGMGITSLVLFIVYNAPDHLTKEKSKIFPNSAYLGKNFSDRDIFRIVTPLIRKEIGGNVQKSIESSALAGNIGEGSLLEVLQFIEIGSKTGCLLIEVGKPFAIICFKNGRIIFAATADKVTGKEAIFKVLDLKVGTFRFVVDKKPKESNLNLSTLEILMEWAKVADEAHKH